MTKRRGALQLGFGFLGLGALIVACSNGEERAGHTTAAVDTPTLQAATVLERAFPKARVEKVAGRVTRAYGSPLTTGATPDDAAERFRANHAAALGADASDLKPDQSGATALATAPQPIGLMYDQKTGQYKFWLYRYRQEHHGMRVYHAGLRTLVRNAGQNPVVWADSSVRALRNFLPATSVTARPADEDKTLRAIRALPGFSGKLVAAPSTLSNVSPPELVVFAGTEGHDAPPMVAMNYVAESANPPGRFDVVADPLTGDVVHVESIIVFDNVLGTVTGNVTSGDKAMECGPTASTPFGFAEVDTTGGGSVFADATGSFSIATAGSAPVSLTSSVGGEFFDVLNVAAASEQLSQSVTPPGPASFVHNAADTDVTLRAEANGYANASQVRSFLLKYLPNYPVISTQQNMPISVNRTDLYCPGNAWYDGTGVNFCLGNTTYTNTAFASVAHHEYGHHIIQSGGSGQGEYGEGMADTVAVLLAGDPGLAFGFYLNQCTTALRTADNTCQYSATSCSSCGSEAHACGNLMSGTIWSVRKALAQTDPDTYVDYLNSLVLSSIPLHKGTSVSPSIAVDLLTLDDDDGTLDNGSPHYAQICSGFQAHGMTCPPLLTGLSVSPASGLSANGNVGGPFSPASIVYTLRNLGPSAPLDFSVGTANPTPWLTISPTSGTLASGDQVDVTVAVDQATAAGLAHGAYDATLRLTNQTNGQGSTTRPVHLQAGVPEPVFTANFENGLGGFTLGTESTNLWHVTQACASTATGHSQPASLFFGLDASCNYSNGATVTGSVTSPAVSISDTSLVALDFSYFLGTEKLSPYDKATAQVSVNGGAYTIVASNNAGGQALVDGTGVWQSTEVDLTSLLAGLSSASVNVRFAFDSGDSVANTFAGFSVDDVIVKAFPTACTSDAQCDDGKFCDGAEHCVNGTCAGGTPVNCDDGVACSVDSCSEATKACTHTPNDAACSDANLCNGAETCDLLAGCKAGTPVNCDDANACTTDACSPTTGCTHTTLSCDDGNACTTDSCLTATGCQHATVTCNDGNGCTDDSCNPTVGCQFTNNTAACSDDSNVCTSDVCSGGVCTHPNNTASCPDDGNSCTSDVCSAGVCTHPNNGTCTAGPFVETGGQVVIEAEHFATTVARSSHSWTQAASSSASGGQLMQATPNNGTTLDTGYVTTSPELDYPITFSTTGTYQVWIRGIGLSANDDSIHAGIDGTGPATSDRITGFGTSLGWSKNTIDNVVATINVTTAGTHTLNLWMREDGFQVDKILLTTSTSFTPSGAGPAESSRGTGCTSAAQCDDGNGCTTDSCTSGVCAHANNTSSCADDGNSCTSDVCRAGTCTHPSNGTCGGSGGAGGGGVGGGGAGGAGAGGKSGGGAGGVSGGGAGGTGGGTTPCAGICTNPTTFPESFQSGNLGTNASCYQTTASLQGGNCGNFSGTKTLSVNGTPMTCNNQNWSSLPAKKNGGYCVSVTSGNFSYAYFTTW